MTSATKNIGTEIRERREVLRLSREGLAYKAGVAHKTIERIESGKVRPRRATLTVIESALASTEADLAGAV